MKGTIIDFLKLAADRPALADELIGLAAKYDFEFTDNELHDTELEQVAGGTTNDELTLVTDRRAAFVSTLSSIMKKMQDAEDPLIDNAR